MRRRHFFGAAVAAVVSGAPAAGRAKPKPGFRPCAFDGLPREIAGKSLEGLRDDCHNRLFGRYLPFWDQGGFDAELGGLICELNDDGSVFRDEKDIWYQGRAVWIYSFLYEHFGKEERFLEIAHTYSGDTILVSV